MSNVTVNGTAQQQQSILTALAPMLALLGDRIQPVTIEVRARASMPRYRDERPGDGPTDGKAEGFWRAGPRRILIADDVLPRDDLEETIGHELVHVLFEDWFDKPQRKALLAYLTPKPENYSDTIVNGKDKGYPALPEECIAVWGSAALFGFAKPAYASLYKRRIDPVQFAAVKATMLGAEPVPEEPPAPLPLPSPDIAAALSAISMAENALETAKGALGG